MLTRKPARSLVILDDFFPNLLTGFRVAEYNAYLERFPHLRILSSYPDFAAAHQDYAAHYPHHAQRVMPLTHDQLEHCGLVYLNFLNNAHSYLPLLEARQLPFILTLYPGGGFGLNEADSDHKLDRVMQSPLLRHVICTQKVTEDYLQRRYGNRVPRSMIFGVVVNPLYFSLPENERPYFRLGKATLDICFVAEKYMPQGANKGYPEFIETIRKLVTNRSALPFRFHVVGSCTASDWNTDGLEDCLQFHGRLNTPDLLRFYRQMDVVISPNKPFLLHKGNFDGFPTGCCVEASLCGVCMVATDMLDLNPAYVDNRDMIIIDPDPESVASRVLALIDTGKLATVACAGQQLTRSLFSPTIQLQSRMEIIRHYARQSGVSL